jgi:uncharacterized glyoxalase superfamily protein PhnB
MLFDSREQFIEVVKKFGADEGLKQNIEKLNSYLKAQQDLRQQLKTNKMTRTCTYLNFPGNTDEAMNYYKKIFGGEFIGGGIQRFADIPPHEGMPPLSDADKQLVLHAELAILGGHVLMATDAPESMGFKLVQGNNMHISLEPDTRDETDRIFGALADGGQITMPLKDMFFGSYYGSCTDKYGINWMVNCNEKK